MSENRDSRINEPLGGLSEREQVTAIEWFAEQMPGGFFIYRADDSQEILYVNQATIRMFGCETNEEFRELTGNTFMGMVHPEDFERIQNSIDEQIADVKNYNMDYVEYRIIRKDGSVRLVDDYGHYGNLPGYGDVYYVFIGDITEKRMAREEQEKARLLAVELKESRRANDAKSAFLSNMSHEIRTPITAILGMNEMIQRESKDKAVLEYADNIEKAGVSLLGIISDILDFSKIEAGKMDILSEKYSLREMIKDLYNLINLRAEAKALKLIFSIDPKLPEVLVGDELRVKQIFINLLTNAVKYTEKGSVELAVKCEEREDDKVSIFVCVEDTGIGIRQEEIEKLFTAFDRLDTKRNRTIEGTGLGLAITRQMLSLMGSELKVESVYDEGSKFYFTLRQGIGGEQKIGSFDVEKEARFSSPQKKQETFFTAPKAHIMLVDDTPMNLQVIAGLLKRTEMKIDLCEDGYGCIEKFGKEQYDMVFMDYRMPNLDGIETLHRLQELYPEKCETTPIISLTASAVSGDREKMLNAGFDDYLTKPVNISEMEEMMLKFLPKEYIIMKDEAVGTEDEGSVQTVPAVLFKSGIIEPQKGIEFCGDTESYMDAVAVYASSIDKKAALIEECLQKGDIENYTLNVHSLKSTSKAIGAGELFERALALEMAGKSGNIETLKADTPGFLKDYRGLKEILEQALDEYDEE